MTEPCTIGPGCEVLMHFSITLADGEMVESTFEDNEPLRFCIGDGMLGAGLEAAVFGLSAGQKQSLEIEAGIAFGEPDPDNIHNLPAKDFIGQENPVKPGMVMDFTIPNGDTLLGTILSVDAENVSVDFNHPLAARAIVFTVEILTVSNVDQ